MRDAPNVPVGAGYNEAILPGPKLPASTSENASPTPKSRNSYTARPKEVAPASEQFVVVDVKEKNRIKDLPATPLGDVNTPNEGEYFDGTPSSPPKMGRRTSLMKRVRGVVKGTK
jgi:hypothetical protein